MPADRLSDLLKGPWPHDGEPVLATLIRLAPTADEGRTLRAFVVGGRLTGLPARHARRDILLRFLLERIFTEDREYTEPEVNGALARFHPDTAALRRYLVDERYVTREGGRYRRARPHAAATGD